jgi:hypothetical protein
MQITSILFKDFSDKAKTAEEIGRYCKGFSFYETTDVDGYWIHFSEYPGFQERKICLRNNGKIADYAKLDHKEKISKIYSQLNSLKISMLWELKKSIFTDGMIDETEVKQLREVLYADGKIDKEEADFLFELNDAVSGKANHSSWETLFVEAISAYLLEDDVIDAGEAQWLLVKIQGDGQLDKTEKALLANLKSQVKNFPSILDLN